MKMRTIPERARTQLLQKITTLIPDRLQLERARIQRLQKMAVVHGDGV